jgi:NAD(P)-dependent dehydrogenase (short-subunit alcohol dehydrogenase family)
MPQVLLITGSSGIAAATATLATSRGTSVFIIGKKQDECEALSSQLKNCSFYVADVSDEHGVKKAMKSCLSRHEHINAVFNVAGLSGRSLGDGPLHECSTAAWQTLMAVHAQGTFFVCREILQDWMAAKQPGVILNTGSVLARYPEPRFFATHAYASSKGAVESMTLAAAGYYAPYKIRLNLLAPALVRTPMSMRAQSNTEIIAFMKQKQPLKGDLIEADEIARVAYFLLSNESFPITGEVVRVDAGWAVTGQQRDP